ncbi:MAG: hypothetical protein KC609_13830 [Myxococcales bacterium]|nr:hypothetical protein [Myxococcales bacterium]
MTRDWRLAYRVVRGRRRLGVALCGVLLALTGSAVFLGCRPKASQQTKSESPAIDSCRAFYEAMGRCGMGIRKTAIESCEAKWAKLDAAGRDKLKTSWTRMHHDTCVKKLDTSSVPADHYCRKLATVSQRCGVPFPDSRLMSCVALWAKGGLARNLAVKSSFDFYHRICPNRAKAISVEAIFGQPKTLALRPATGEIRGGGLTLRFRFQEPVGFEKRKPRVYQGKPVLDELSYDVPGAVFEWFGFQFGGYGSYPLKERIAKYLGTSGTRVHESKGLSPRAVGAVLMAPRGPKKAIYSGEFLYETRPKGPTLRCHFRLNSEHYARYGRALIRSCETLTILPH